MNEYLLDPNLIYTWHICEGLQTFFTVFLVLTALAATAVIAFYIAFNAMDDWSSEKTQQSCLHWGIILLILVTIFAAGVIFIPTKETMIEMTVAKLITKDNLNWTVEQVKEIAEYVVGLLK